MQTPQSSTFVNGQEHGSYFVQQTQLDMRFDHLSRFDILTHLAFGKSVLHVGCADWPITNLSQNLHIMLDKVTSILDGVDTSQEAIELLRPHVKGSLYRSLDEVQGSYDMVIVPEVLEHVGNLEDFLQKIDLISANDVIFTVPNAFRRPEFFEYRNDGSSLEVVHPDHNYWFSPFTLSNVIRKYTHLKVNGLFSVGTMSVMAICSF